MRWFIALGLIAGAVVLSFFAGRYILAENADTPAENADTQVGPLMWAERTHLSICVERFGQSATSIEVDDATLAKVRDALDDQLETLGDVPPEYDQPGVSAGCPLPLAKLGTRLTEGDDFGRHVESPSEHEAFMYLLDPNLYAQTFGDRAYMTTSEEFFCHGDACIGVTLGVYLPTDANGTVLGEALASALLLLRPTPSPEPTLDWSACERGEQPAPHVDCERYDDWRREQGR